MNRFFRVVFNERLGSWVVVSEMAKASGKKSGAVEDLSAHHSHLNSLSRFSGSLKKGLWRFAPVSLAVWGIFATPLHATDVFCDYDSSIEAFKCGQNNTASGKNSVALGRLNEANNTDATALGIVNKAYGEKSFAAGFELPYRLAWL